MQARFPDAGVEMTVEQGKGIQPAWRGWVILLGGFLGLCTIFVLVVTAFEAWQEHAQAQWPQVTASIRVAASGFREKDIQDLTTAAEGAIIFVARSATRWARRRRSRTSIPPACAPQTCSIARTLGPRFKNSRHGSIPILRGRRSACTTIRTTTRKLPS